MKLKNSELHSIFFFSQVIQKSRKVRPVESSSYRNINCPPSSATAFFIIENKSKKSKKWTVFQFGDTSKQSRPDELVRLLVKLASHPSIPLFLSFKNAHQQNVLKNAAKICEEPHCGTISNSFVTADRTTRRRLLEILTVIITQSNFCRILYFLQKL